MEPLDNPVWTALTSLHAPFAETSGPARRYHPEMGVFAGAERLDEASWRAVAELVGPGGVAVLFRRQVPHPPEFCEELFRTTAHQMVLDEPAPQLLDVEPVLLGPDDVLDMLTLTALAKPGPFLGRTAELGRYWGIRGPEGRLVALAGERMRTTGATEISAVSIRPDTRRQGFGAGITAFVAGQIQAQGDRPFLHVASDNDSARRIYETLGFRTRAMVDIVAVRTPVPDDQASR